LDRRWQRIWVFVIALIEFARAAFVLRLAMQPSAPSDSQLASPLCTMALLWIVPKPPGYSPSPFDIIDHYALIAFALSYAVMGIGLLCWWQWARGFAMGFACLNVVILLRGTLVHSYVFGWRWQSLPQPLRQGFLFVIAVDSLIFLCLALYPGMAEAFGERH
jgi:hypothetical protein